MTDAARWAVGGVKPSRDVIRRRRLVERFLFRVLGLERSAAHEEAEVVAPVVSDRVERLLWDVLLGDEQEGTRRADGPVVEHPGHEGVRDHPGGDESFAAVIKAVDATDAQVAQQLRRSGLHPGADVAIGPTAPRGTSVLGPVGHDWLTPAALSALTWRPRTER